MQNHISVAAFLLVLCLGWNSLFVQIPSVKRDFKQIQETCGDVTWDSITSVVRSEERLNQCIHIVEEFLRLSPDVAEAHLLLAELGWNKAIAYASDKQEKELLMAKARDEAQKAVELAPNNIEALDFFASILPKEREDEAVSALQKIIKLDPANDEAYWSLGMRALNAGRVEEGMKFLHRAMELITVPEIINEKWHNLVMVLSEKGLNKQALEISEAILRRGVGEGHFSQIVQRKIETEAIWLRGILLAEQEQTLEQGLRLMEGAIARVEKPDLAMGKRRQLADLLKAKGRYREALRWYETLLPSQDVEAIIRDLEKKVQQQRKKK